MGDGTRYVGTALPLIGLYDDSPWNYVAVKSLITPNSRLESAGGNEDVKGSLVEQGADSLSLMTQFLSLQQQQQQGKHDNTPMTSSRDYGDVMSSQIPNSHSVSTRPIFLELNNLPEETSKYCIVPLAKVSAERAQNILAECFAAKGPLGQCQGDSLTEEDLRPPVEWAWPKLLKWSIVVMDETKNEMVGVTTLADLADLADLLANKKEYCPFVKELSNYFADLENNLPNFLPEPLEEGVVLSIDRVATCLKCSPAENFHIVYLMIKEAHRLAQKYGFKMSVAYNSNPMTQQLASFYGCRRLVTSVPKDYVNRKGEQPFIGLPESTTVTVDVKDY